MKRIMKPGQLCQAFKCDHPAQVWNKYEARFLCKRCDSIWYDVILKNEIE